VGDINEEMDKMGTGIVGWGLRSCEGSVVQR
jgi:hypothetical protein